jgi:hypothetical protein
MSFYLLSKNAPDSNRTSRGLFKDGESTEPLKWQNTMYCYILLPKIAFSMDSTAIANK